MGNEDGSPYGRFLDAVLISPPFPIPDRGRLSIWHRIDAESLSTGRAWDGGTVEISVSGGRWKALAPAGGYPFRLETGSGNPLYGRDVFSGRSSGFRRAVFDLAPFARSAARVRFRFASDAFTAPSSEQSQTGWVIDDLEIAPAPAGVVVSAVVLAGGEVRITGDSEGSGPATYLVYRRSPIPEARPILIDRITAAGTWSLTDLPPAGRYIYIVRPEEAGEPGLEFLSPVVEAPGAGVGPRIAGAFPLPFRTSGSPLQVETFIPSGSAGSPFSLDLFDVQGRRVAGLAGGEARAGTNRWTWTGMTPAGRIGSGIYWISLTVNGKTAGVRRVTVLP
jgi:hypothetical protein